MKVFIEEQRFTQLWVHVLLAVSSIVPILLVSFTLVKVGWQDEDARIGFIVVMLATIFVYGLIFSLKLQTKINDQGIHYRFIPFHFSNRLIEWKDIEEAYIRKYDAISEYGGWGIKGGTLWYKKNGVAYNVKGSIGIQFELKNGRKILIGTQKEEEAKRVLNTYKHKMIS